MGCFNTLFILMLAAVYLLPDLRPITQIEGFWFTIIAVWLCFFISWALFGDIADEISGVNKYKDDEF
tara:strand:+ start:189 stop:389 length:201 start_codon:yes stop_codon:yes gene_type:complete